MSHVDGVPLGDELAIDDATRAIFVTDRDLNGNGALTRVAAGGLTSRVVTGQTAEGLAIDRRRRIVYVANVNDGTVRYGTHARCGSSAVSKRWHGFFRSHFHPTIALVRESIQSAGSPFAAPGSAVEIDLTHPGSRIVARSGALSFPLGAALDAATGTLFVTDESLDVVDVLDSRTLKQKHLPLSTCRTPWKPALDPAAGRLYVPCARDDAVDVFDASSLKRVAGAPFHTGSYPLAVAVWPATWPAKGSAGR